LTVRFSRFQDDAILGIIEDQLETPQGSVPDVSVNIQIPFSTATD
jgi:hypothetical protein